jgi:hypothetical protein
MPDTQPGLIHYLPLLTTAISAVFFAVLVRAALVRKSGPHLTWWAAGVFFYGLGTLIESGITLGGNSVFMTKAWYIFGALLGGYPLAQGSVWLLMRKEAARTLTMITVPVIVLGALFVVLSPANLAALEPHRPTGKVLEWSWIRLMTPFINVYAAVFLIGGAIYSARKYANEKLFSERAFGNVLIAVGAILPGIGGSMAKVGMVEALYVGECVGLMLIWGGYHVIASRKAQRATAAAQPAHGA